MCNDNQAPAGARHVSLARPYYGRFNVLSKETRTDDSKDASTKCPQGPGSGHIVFNVLSKKQGEMI